jgi:hypothetical protein
MNSICAVSYLNGMIPECTYSFRVGGLSGTGIASWWANTYCSDPLQAGQAVSRWANTQEILGHLLGGHCNSSYSFDFFEYLDASASRLEEVSSIAVTQTESCTDSVCVTSKPRINWVGHSTCNQVRTRSPGFEPEVICPSVF